MEARYRFSGSGSGDAVSYTHLDVYKRQDNDWKFKQIVIPFDEKKGIYCTLGYEVIFERKK